MGSRAAGLEEGALLDDDDVSPAELRQVVCDTASHDPRADDDRPGVLRHRGVRHVGCTPVRRKANSVRFFHAGIGYDRLSDRTRLSGHKSLADEEVFSFLEGDVRLRQDEV